MKEWINLYLIHFFGVCFSKTEFIDGRRPFSLNKRLDILVCLLYFLSMVFLTLLMVATDFSSILKYFVYNLSSFLIEFV